VTCKALDVTGQIIFELSEPLNEPIAILWRHGFEVFFSFGLQSNAILHDKFGYLPLSERQCIGTLLGFVNHRSQLKCLGALLAERLAEGRGSATVASAENIKVPKPCPMPAEPRYLQRLT
jgi:hypothetical protein